MSPAAQKFVVEDVIDEARLRTAGLDDFGRGPFRQPLELLVESLNAEANLNEIGRYIATERMLTHTVNRLNYVRDRERFPEISNERIVKPVFIVGLPRTGTTILHDILGQDPSNRVPMTWEAMFPSPPPEAATFETDPRIAMCEATFPGVELQIPAFKAMHPMGAQLSQECVTLMGEAMCTPLFHNQFRVPAYQDWVDDSADWSHVYEMHERQLQHLQWRNPRERWVLKTGAHLWGLGHLLARYPDARVIFTHRDPVKSMTSYASLTALVRSMGSDTVDPVEIANDWTARLQKVLTRAIEIRAADSFPQAQFYDMFFEDFIVDQFGEVSKIYDALSLPMSDLAAERMQAFIADNPPGKHGIHRYEPHEFGVDPARVRSEFATYIGHFGLTPESE